MSEWQCLYLFRLALFFKFIGQILTEVKSEYSILQPLSHS